MRFASPAEAIRRPEAHGTTGIILPKPEWHQSLGSQMAPWITVPGPQWHHIFIVLEQMAPWITLLERQRRPGITFLEPQGTPGSLFWSQMASRITLLEPEKHSRITLRSQDGSPAARWGRGGEILYTFIKFDVSRGGTTGSNAPPGARAGATEGGRGEDKSSPGLGIRISTSLLVIVEGSTCSEARGLGGFQGAPPP